MGIKKRMIVFAATAVTLAAVLAGGSLAWLTAAESATNRFTTGVVDIEVEESFTPPNSTTVGQTVKQVWLQNPNRTDGRSVPVYVRARVVPIWRNADGTGAGIPALAGEYAVTLNYKSGTAWVLRGEHYYYKTVLEAGAKTANLLEAVTVQRVPQGAYLEVQVLADAVQTEAGAAADAWGVNPATL